MVRRAAHPARGNLLADLSSFVGRRRELADVKRLISEYRLVTVCGIGGVGKTRLAQRVAAQVARAYADGVWIVDLAELGERDWASAPGTSDGDRLATVVAGALGLREHSARAPLAALRDHLQERSLLLVMDNCEHLLPACAELIRTLLGSCPGLRVIATSRELLGLIGEAAFSLPPLPVPDPAELPSLTEATTYEAVALFTERAHAVLAGFRLTPENYGAVVDICHRLDGLPLAIELAAARLRLLTPQQIATRLGDRFALLSGGNRLAPERQQTLRGCLDWSYELCWKPEQRLWAQLSVFAGNFAMDAIEGICAGADLVAEDLLSLTAALIDKSILSRDDRDVVVRYRLLESIRAYGREKLHDNGDEAALLRRHRDWYAELVERSNREWIGNRQAYWLRRLNQEHANLRTALDYCLGVAGEPERALHILVRLPALYWWGRGRFDEGRGWLDRALGRAAEPSAERARALLLASRLAFGQGDIEASGRLLAEGEEIGRQLDDSLARSSATFIRGTTALFENDLATAVRLLETALEGLDGAGPATLDQRLHLLFTLVAAAGLNGDHDLAASCYKQVLAETEPRGEDFHRSNAMWAFGLAAWRQGDLHTAAAHEEAGLRLKRASGLEDPLGAALCLEVLTWVETGRQPQRAAVLLGAVDAQWSRHGTSIDSYRHLVGHRRACERRTRRALDEPSFADAYRRGRGFTYDESIAFALRERRPTPEADTVSQTPLTPREHQVAVLVAQGLSNADIARHLVISQRTAESHVANILTKRGFTSRAQIAAWIGTPGSPG
ncbi:ATP-binding protein [Actinoplanes subtropicus]|uniref:ATP-binding protein n=1 Tax=Actinoplanes subtropicus TaxID=543632 RepID=UPI0007C44735|nr:LuxR C-terminal-related transcriptional regulator [Actinoplanes subtropicus]